MRRSFCGSHRERVEAAVALQGSRRRRRISLELDEFERPGGRALVEDSPEVEAYLAALSMGPSRPRRASIDCPRVTHTLEESPEEGVKEPSGNEAAPFDTLQEHSQLPSQLHSHIQSHQQQQQQQQHQQQQQLQHQQQRQDQYQRQYQHRHQQQHRSRSDAVESDADSKHANAHHVNPNQEASKQEQGGAGEMAVLCQSAMAEQEPRRPERPQRSSDSQRTRSLLFSARRACASLIRRKDSGSSVAANPATTERSMDLDVDTAASGRPARHASCPRTHEGSAPEAPITDTWAGDGKLKEWVDWSIVDKALRPPELMQAQAALIAGSRSTGCLVPATAATSKS